MLKDLTYLRGNVIYDIDCKKENWQVQQYQKSSVTVKMGFKTRLNRRH